MGGFLLSWAEPLPPLCPPNDAADVEWELIYRLIDAAVPSANAFASNAALGMTPPEGMDECRWSSCSLVFDPKRQKKLPRFKNTHHWAAAVKVPVGAGLSKQSSKNHVDFWCRAAFNVHTAVQNVVDI